eukprot:g1441.t1
MPFHRLLNKYIGDNFSNFMTQYEATRTVSETLLESMPQLEYVNQEAKDSRGYKHTALSAAIMTSKHEDIKLYLLKNGADLSKAYKVEFPRGRFEDVKLFITSHDVNNTSMTLTDMLNQEGKDSEADPNIATSGGWNALHLAALYNKKDTKLIEFLLTNMPLTSINKKDRRGYTPLDWAYNNNKSPIQQKIIDLIRSKGGKRSSEL